jgi:hypothetical protein
MKKCKLFFWAILGLVIVLAPSCKEDASIYERSEYGASYLAGKKIKKGNFQILWSGRDSHNSRLKSIAALNYLQDGDTLTSQTSERFVIQDVDSAYQDFVFQFGIDEERDADPRDSVVVIVYYVEQSSGPMQLIISADSADWILADTFNLFCYPIDFEPYIPVPTNLVFIGSSNLGAGVYQYIVDVPARASWTNSHSYNVQGIKGNNTWAIYSNTTAVYSPVAGYIRVTFNLLNGNYEPSTIASADGASVINTFTVRNASLPDTWEGWLEITSEGMGNYYANGSIGYTAYNGQFLPYNYNSVLPFIEISGDGKIGQTLDSIYVNYIGVTSTARFIRATVDPDAGTDNDVSVDMLNNTMYGGINIMDNSFLYNGSRWAVLKPGFDSELMDISGWDQVNDSTNAIVLHISLLKSSGNNVRLATAEEITKLNKAFPMLGIKEE